MKKLGTKAMTAALGLMVVGGTLVGTMQSTEAAAQVSPGLVHAQRVMEEIHSGSNTSDEEHDRDNRQGKHSNREHMDEANHRSERDHRNEGNHRDERNHEAHRPDFEDREHRGNHPDFENGDRGHSRPPMHSEHDRNGRGEHRMERDGGDHACGPQNGRGNEDSFGRGRDGRPPMHRDGDNDQNHRPNHEERNNDAAENSDNNR